MPIKYEGVNFDEMWKFARSAAAQASKKGKEKAIWDMPRGMSQQFNADAL